MLHKLTSIRYLSGLMFVRIWFTINSSIYLAFFALCIRWSLTRRSWGKRSVTPSRTSTVSGKFETTCKQHKTCCSFPVSSLCPFNFIKKDSLLSSDVHACPLFHVCVKSAGSSVCFCFLSSVTSLFLFSLTALRVSLLSVLKFFFHYSSVSVCSRLPSSCVPVSHSSCVYPPPPPLLLLVSMSVLSVCPSGQACSPQTWHLRP